jgi:hypothetical protein
MSQKKRTWLSPEDTAVLAKKIRAIGRKTGVPISEAQAMRMARRTRDRLRAFTTGVSTARPAQASKALNKIAEHLTQARDQIEGIGTSYLLHVYAAAGRQTEVGSQDVSDHLAYLFDLAEWTRTAAKVASELPTTKTDQRGGRRADPRLRNAVFYLGGIYQDELGIHPKHVIDINTGLRASCFDLYVHAAFRTFLSKKDRPGLRAIDAAVASAVRMWGNPKGRKRRRTVPA